MKKFYEIHTRTIELHYAGLVRDHLDPRHEDELRRGNPLFFGKSKKAIMLDKLQSDQHERLFNLWLLDESRWRWKYLLTSHDEVVVLLTRRSRCIPTGEWLQDWCH
jgi:hypothetical protein